MKLLVETEIVISPNKLRAKVEHAKVEHAKVEQQNFENQQINASKLSDETHRGSLFSLKDDDLHSLIN